MHGVLVAQRRIAQAAAETPQIKTVDDLNAWVTAKLAEIDELIKEAEDRIASLKDDDDDVSLKDDDDVIRAWYAGALKGLQLARAAWKWWTQEQAR